MADECESAEYNIIESDSEDLLAKRLRAKFHPEDLPRNSCFRVQRSAKGKILSARPLYDLPTAKLAPEEKRSIPEKQRIDASVVAMPTASRDLRGKENEKQRVDASGVAMAMASRDRRPGNENIGKASEASCGSSYRENFFVPDFAESQKNRPPGLSYAAAAQASELQSNQKTRNRRSKRGGQAKHVTFEVSESAHDAHTVATQLKAQNRQPADQSIDFRAEIRNLQSIIEAKDFKMKDLQEKANADAVKQRRAFDELHAKHDELQTKFQDANKSGLKTAKQLGQLRNENDVLKAKALIDKCRLKGLQEKAELLPKKEFQDIAAQTDVGSPDQPSNNSASSAELTAALSKIADLEPRCLALEAQLKGAYETHLKSVAKISEQEGSLNAKDSEITELRFKLKELQETLDRFFAVEGHVSQAESKRSAFATTLQDQANDEIAFLRSKLYEAENTISFLQREKMVKLLELATLREQSESALSEFNASQQRLSSEYHQAVAKLQGQINILEANRDGLNELIGDLIKGTTGIEAQDLHREIKLLKGEVSKNQAMECSICLERLPSGDLTRTAVIPCGHVYCTQCIQRHEQKRRAEFVRPECPNCRQLFHGINLPGAGAKRGKMTTTQEMVAKGLMPLFFTKPDAGAS